MKALRALAALLVPLGLIVVAAVLAYGTLGPASALPPTTPIPTIGPMTPLPDRGVRVGTPRELSLPPGVVITRGLEIQSLAAYSGTLVASAQMTGGMAVVAIDLDTGRSQRLATATSGFYVAEVSVSPNYVVWTEYPDAGALGDRVLHMYDRRTAHDTILKRGLLGNTDMRDSLVIWSERRDRPVTELYAYRLDTSHEFVVMDYDLAEYHQARVCSNEWIIYLTDVPPVLQRGTDAEVDLHARNISTGEDLTIGRTIYPAEAGAGKLHACDGRTVGWMEVPDPAAASRHFQQRVYDLATRSNRVIGEPMLDYGLPVQRIDGDLVIGVAGFDLSRNVAFSLPAPGWALLVTGERVTWVVQPPPYTDPQHLYVAPIIRDAH